MTALAKILRTGLLAVVLLAAPSAIARELTEAERTGLAAAIAEFDAAMREKNIAKIIAVVPPKVFERLAADNGLETKVLIETMIAQTEQVMATAKFLSFGMDLENTTYKETPDGTPYALIPTETVMDFGESGGKIEARSQTFAMLDAGTWYLVRTDDAGMLAILREIYPSYAAEQFPVGTTEPVE